eukprot:CAMPEP_0183445998 /NCGR_PEP_ID=MMETSP0370-20130417/96658_1 /TAXON_ID=268820 /ORGANISM="Peridinium aciculiferum, Strain PAER-2" /LENGTH=55 /DNA_ID=CAMNT_0025636669 /DNA_START=710 /DNA_END=877 /DNA_ORIENTATION=+
MSSAGSAVLAVSQLELPAAPRSKGTLALVVSVRDKLKAVGETIAGGSRPGGGLNG